ncbi:hypothetical protein CK203_114740 [Vitis vinifera]|uniref:Retrovirus-related Pol polyprotein from transposon TNT 1-94 n=1 Tax=Vitis vinifera TaxID=29760 RepID=A0A438CY23_VITVI|nr:hypothetical protein CK203_114740 [Vitis vinifera]
MKDEMDSLLRNQTWELTELPVGKKALHNKLVLGMVAAKNLHLEQLDVKTAFLHGDLEKDLYMIQPLLDSGTRSLTVLCIELGSRDVKLITVAMLSLLTSPTSYYCCMWMICLLQGLALRRLIIEEAIVQTVCNEGFGSYKANPWFNMNEAKPVSTPLGSHFKLNIAHAVGVVSRFMSRLGKQHWEGYVDVDFAGDIDSKKSTTEYVAATEAGKEMIWLHGFLDELDKLVILEKIYGSKNPADMLTKGVTIEKFEVVHNFNWSSSLRTGR